MTLSERACVKPFQSSLGALGHNTPSLLTAAASGAAVNKPAHYYTRLTHACMCVCVHAIQRLYRPSLVQECCYIVAHHSGMRFLFIYFIVFYFILHVMTPSLESAPFRSDR